MLLVYMNSFFALYCTHITPTCKAKICVYLYIYIQCNIFADIINLYDHIIADLHICCRTVFQFSTCWLQKSVKNVVTHPLLKHLLVNVWNCVCVYVYLRTKDKVESTLPFRYNFSDVHIEGITLISCCSPASASYAYLQALYALS